MALVNSTIGPVRNAFPVSDRNRSFLQVSILRLTGNEHAAKLKWHGKTPGWHPLWWT
jgi:hypothetical protein